MNLIYAAAICKKTKTKKTQQPPPPPPKQTQMQILGWQNHDWPNASDGGTVDVFEKLSQSHEPVLASELSEMWKSAATSKNFRNEA